MFQTELESHPRVQTCFPSSLHHDPLLRPEPDTQRPSLVFLFLLGASNSCSLFRFGFPASVPSPHASGLLIKRSLRPCVAWTQTSHTHLRLPLLLGGCPQTCWDLGSVLHSELCLSLRLHFGGAGSHSRPPPIQQTAQSWGLLERSHWACSGHSRDGPSRPVLLFLRAEELELAMSSPRASGEHDFMASHPRPQHLPLQGKGDPASSRQSPRPMPVFQLLYEQLVANIFFGKLCPRPHTPAVLRRVGGLLLLLQSHQPGKVSVANATPPILARATNQLPWCMVPTGPDRLLGEVTVALAMRYRWGGGTVPADASQMTQSEDTLRNSGKKGKARANQGS
ncbi:hypothetical protein Cadr_000027194 [Camelus dromedarius]|uniref:Uncharacterized protein n=1 Tax=Camelus dromedarius TaxID=9838 RepID=A0A5N4C4Q6_CAMDR|nr:hypothetical protein Cadr_000027194 [Camelus dromedarius]